MDQGAERTFETLATMLNRLAGVTSQLEQTVGRLEEQQLDMSGQVQKIVATVEQGPNMSFAAGIERIYNLERKLQEAVQQITELRGQGASSPLSGRKTIAPATVTLLAKQGIASLDSVEAGSLDSALSGLSVEQRIAIKSQLLRAGVLNPA